jgi:3-deoxy-D-manno-octulosonate 8-phosphate phosphatase (KDO 8-P phosphatase)
MSQARIKLIAMDVDGVLTDGGISLGSGGFEAKTFNVRDGLGLHLLIKLGYELAWITGRSSEVVERRACELKVQHVRQGVTDKAEALEQLLSRLGMGWENVLYIGDDLNDLVPLQKAAIACTVKNAGLEVKRVADYTAELNGGAGAVREIVEWFLKKELRWSEAVNLYLKGNPEAISEGEVTQ